MVGSAAAEVNICKLFSFCCWTDVQYCGRALGHSSKELSLAKGASGLRRMKRVSPLGSIWRISDGFAILREETMASTCRLETLCVLDETLYYNASAAVAV